MSGFNPGYVFLLSQFCYTVTVKNNVNSEIIILPTDTLYGICASAFNKKSVERIYDIKGRDENKPFIILISKLKDLEDFGIDEELIKKHKKLFSKVWPGKVSVILPIQKKFLKKFEYLHRGTGKLAFRLPAKKSVVALLKKFDSIVAPSANPQGLKPAETIKEAKKYFGDKIDLYIAGGRLKGSPSTIIEMTNDGEVNIVRVGAVRVKLTDLPKR